MQKPLNSDYHTVVVFDVPKVNFWKQIAITKKTAGRKKIYWVLCSFSVFLPWLMYLCRTICLRIIRGNNPPPSWSLHRWSFHEFFSDTFFIFPSCSYCVARKGFTDQEKSFNDKYKRLTRGGKKRSFIQQSKESPCSIMSTVVSASKPLPFWWEEKAN